MIFGSLPQVSQASGDGNGSTGNSPTEGEELERDIRSYSRGGPRRPVRK